MTPTTAIGSGGVSAARTRDALGKHSRVPGQIEIDHHASSLKIQAHPTSIGGIFVPR